MKKEFLKILVLGAIALYGNGCGRSFTAEIMEETQKSDIKIKAEAYLFDAQLKRNGKPTSFRLDLYQTDTLIGIGGRGYLGKGALKGWMSTDSIKVYFPSTNEYVYEAIEDLMNSFECSGNLSSINLTNLFYDLPDRISQPDDINIEADYKDKKQPEFIITPQNCSWRISLIYDKQDTGWRIKNFEFSDGDKTILKADRRIYKNQSNIPINKFQFHSVSDAVRIIP